MIRTAAAGLLNLGDPGKLLRRTMDGLTEWLVGSMSHGLQVVYIVVIWKEN
jgi:hypothetical protein